MCLSACVYMSGFRSVFMKCRGNVEVMTEGVLLLPRDGQFIKLMNMNKCVHAYLYESVCLLVFMCGEVEEEAQEKSCFSHIVMVNGCEILSLTMNGAAERITW